jgi:midasin
LNEVLEINTIGVERGSGWESIKAKDGFCIIATMNPSGDYGKKELSPALRNRFTEIWV